MTVALPYVLLALAIVLILAGGAVVLALAARRRLAAVEAERAVEAARSADKLRRAEGLLAALPGGYLLLDAVEGVPADSLALRHSLDLDPQRPIDFDGLLAALTESHAARLREAVGALRASGQDFSMMAALGSGAKVLRLEGRRIDLPGGDERPCLISVQDVTALHREVRQARARGQAMAEIVNAVPIPIWRRGDDLSLKFVNRAYAEAVGASASEVCRDGLELLGAKKSQGARAVARQALELGTPAAEMHHTVVAGERRLLEISEVPLPNSGLLGFAVDRTQLEDLQSELDRHVRVQADVMENLATAIAIFGADLCLKFFNTSYQRLLDLDEGFLNGEPHLGDILEALRDRRRLPEVSNFPEFKSETLKRFGRLIEAEEELQHLPDGSTLRLLATPHPFGGVLFTYEDVTDRLALEASYNTLIDVQRETLDKLYEGVAVYGADGRLKLFNPAFAQIWNLAETFLRGEPHVREVVERVHDFSGRDPDEAADKIERMVANTTTPDARSGRMERGDQTVIDWAQVPLPDGAVLLTFVDVTDSTRVERALMERNEALETADRLKSQFIANISYELRTPLNAIIGFAEILDNQFFGALNERQSEYSKGIVESSRQLMTLINDILDLASVEAGYLSLEVEPVDVAELLASIETLGHERARNQGIVLRVDCQTDLPSLRGDGRRLKQALFNLLSNALQFTPEGGKVLLAADGDEQEIRLCVEDSGAGIAVADRERVFGKFERGKRQAGQTGAGLGLSLVKSLVELHGGWVELESEVGEGTRITCHVPRLPPQADSAAEETAAQAAAAGD